MFKHRRHLQGAYTIISINRAPINIKTEVCLMENTCCCMFNRKFGISSLKMATMPKHEGANRKNIQGVSKRALQL
jgi:hypothetical protein